MSKINTIRVLNKSVEGGKDELVISTEWSDEKVKIMILRDSNTPLVGEAQFEDLNKYAKSFDKTLQQYIGESKDILCNNSIDVEFHLKEDKFFWKKKKWALGQITVKPEIDVGVISTYTLRLIEDYSKIKDNQLKLEKENEDLKLLNSQVINQLNIMISIKNQLEATFYKKSLALVNSKKEEIRNLKMQLDKMNEDNKIYDALTDESEDELKSCTDVESDFTNCNKRLLKEKDDMKEDKNKKTESNTNACEKSLKEDEETPDFISDESMYEMELKFEDEKSEEGAIQQSSEEMF